MTELNFDGFDDFEMDENLESGQGVALDYDDGRTIIIHRAGGSNKKFERVLRAAMKPHQRKFNLGTISPEKERELLIDVYAKAVVIGWSGITANGTEVPFTPENCAALFKAYPDLFQDVRDAATQLSNFRKAEKEDAEKNSGASSAGAKKQKAGDSTESNG
jgi:hypothetical protein